MEKKYHIIILLLQPVSIRLTLSSKKNSNPVDLIGTVRLVFCIFQPKSSFTLRRQWHFLCLCHCCHKWVQYPFMMTMAMEKMGNMELSDGVHIAAVTAMEKNEFFSPFRCRCRRSVNEP